MALKNPWEVSSKPKPVPVYVDGERVGTAESASVRLTGFHGPIESVELTGLSERPVPVGLLQRNYDVMVRDRKIEELEAEVERLKESRKEQAEKHKQKMRNLQHNFEQQSAGKARSMKLTRQLESSQSYNEHLKLCVEEKDAELVEVKSKYYRQSLDLDVQVKSVKDLRAKLDKAESQRQNVADQNVKLEAENGKLKREQGNDSYWHEKYLENEDALTTVRDAYRRLLGERNELRSEYGLLNKECSKLVDDYNRLNDDINCFLEDFSEGATAINRAVEDWNATVPE